MSEHIFAEVQLYKEGGIGTYLPMQFEDSLHRALSMRIKTSIPGTCIAIGNWLLDEGNLICQTPPPDLHKITDIDTHISTICEHLEGTTYLALPIVGNPLLHIVRHVSVQIQELSEAVAVRFRQQLHHAVYEESVDDQHIA